MSSKTGFAKFVYLVGIVLLGITALFTIASGLGTICVALNPTGFGENMALLARFQWLYILYVILTTAIGGLITYAEILFIKRKPKAYSTAIAALMAGLVVGIIHIITSRGLRGKSMPVDAVVYTTIITLLVLLLFRIRSIREQINHASPDVIGQSTQQASLITLLLSGLLTITIPIWIGPSHTWDGTNWAAAFRFITNGLGLLLVISALVLSMRRKWARKPPTVGGAGFDPKNKVQRSVYNE